MKMRKLMAVLFALCLTVGAMALSASAKTVASGHCGDEGDNVKWVLDDKGTFTISGTGKMKDYVSEFEWYWDEDGQRKYGLVANTPWYADRSKIKSVVIKSGVTSIGDSVFYSCRELVSVSIPSTVKSVGDRSFLDCLQLKSITISGNVKTIGDDAFASCGLETVTLENGIETIGEDAFNGCNDIETLIIPDSVTSIGQSAFSCCNRLTSLTLSKNLKTIPYRLVAECRLLKKLVIPASVTKIDRLAFNGCGQLTEIRFLGDAPTFSDEAFVSLISNSDSFKRMVYYPRGNTTWTATKRQNYGGNMTWEAYTLTPLAITTQPKTVYAKSGAKATVTVKATGDSLSYAWYTKDKGQTKYVKSSVTTASYSVTMTSARKDRLLYCIVTDKYGRTVKTNTVALRMAASITAQPQNVCAASGSVAKTKVTAAGDGLSYTWYIKAKGASKFTKSSVTGSVYSIRMSSANDGRQAYCVVKDKYGKSVTSSTVTLGLPVKVTTQPKSAYAKNGAKATVTVKATGNGLTYTWYTKDKGQTKYMKSSVTTASYSVTMTSARKDRLLYCVVKDKFGNTVQTKTVALRMAASITTQPKSVTAVKGKTAKVTLKAAGDGLSYTWYYKDKGASKFTKTTSFKSTTYSVSMTAARSGRQVYCVVKDKYGKTVKTNTVTLKMK